MSKRSVPRLAVAAAMLSLVALSARSSAGGANAQDVSVLQQLSTNSADPARGRDIWFNNTYGGQKFFWFLQNHPDPARRVNIGFPNIINTPRAVRFTTWGVVNDPDCTANPAGGADICADPNATGVVGMRKFPAPGGATMYGVSCGLCHAGFDPLNPPADPNDPSWDNIHGSIGNQYLKFGAMFAVNLAPTDSRRLIFAAWPDGAVDTQLLFTDNMSPPRVLARWGEVSARRAHGSGGVLRPCPLSNVAKIR